MKVNIASLMAEHELLKQNRFPTKAKICAKSIFNVLGQSPFSAKMSLKMQYKKKIHKRNTDFIWGNTLEVSNKENWFKGNEENPARDAEHILPDRFWHLLSVLRLVCLICVYLMKWQHTEHLHHATYSNTRQVFNNTDSIKRSI